MRSPRTNFRRPLSTASLPTALALGLVVSLLLHGTADAAPTDQAAHHHGGHHHGGHHGLPAGARHGATHAATHGARHGARHAGASPRADAVLRLLDQARSQPQTCGSHRYPAVGPLHLDRRLSRAARGFARLMASQNFFDHTSPAGSTPGHRISAAGYDWHTYGENIAAGFDTPADVVQGWLASPEHCANIMTSFDDLGVGFAHDPTSAYGSYWVTDLGTSW